MSPSLGEQLKAREGFDTVEQELYLSILHTADRLSAELASLLKGAQLTNAAYNVLRILRGAREDDGLPCSEISARMLHRDSDITRLVDRLEKRGLVERRRQEDDRRVVRVSVTTAGLELLSEFDAPVHELHLRQFGHVGKKRLAELARLLASVRDR